MGARKEWRFLYYALRETTDWKDRALKRVWLLSEILSSIDDAGATLVAKQIREAVVGEMPEDIADQEFTVFLKNVEDEKGEENG